MNQSSSRRTRFLQEMGIGVQWTLRNAPEADGFAEAVQALADGVSSPDAAVAAAVAAHQAVQPPTPRVAQPLAEAAVSQAEAEPVRSALVAAVEAAAARSEAPAATPGDDMSWFDDAPVPAPSAAAAASSRPAAALKAPAHPPAGQAASAGRPSAAAPSSAPSRPAAPADMAAADEDTSWFDDAPAPPSAPAAPQTLAAAAPQPPAPVSDDAIAAMDWPALQAAVSSCTRCPLCETRRAAVNGRGAERAAWVAIAGMPSAADEQDQQAVTGESGQLLHNMLKAIELKPESDVYVTNVVKCRPPERNPSAEEVIACRPYLERELALTGATMAMTFGQFAARGLMMGPAARGQVMRYNDLPVVATYHPNDLLRKPEDKAKAWADLCLAKASHA